jgi:hypothetical protein
VSYIDDEGSIIVPKSVRPTIEYEETLLGDKKGAKRQFRYKNLHIREYGDYYTVHMDKVDPRKDPFGHLLIDAPEYLVGLMSAISMGKLVGFAFNDNNKTEDNKKRTQLSNVIAAGCIMTSAAITSYTASNIFKKLIRST